ncbi:hypothetical protein, partial [Bradyrhizobium sp. 87]|uniref:hypothetical protein n=1 Tax=Bradyrhizobium sp. 87 TaxID=2782682 RepID=UPI001FF9ECCF
DRLRSFNFCMGRSIGSSATMDAISSSPPHSISLSAGDTPSMMPRGASPALAIYATRWPVVGRARRVCRLGQDRVGQDTFAVFHEESASPQRESRLRRGIRMAASVRRSGVIMFCPILLNVFAFMRPCFVGTETTMQKHQTSLEKIERKKDDAVFLGV